jgi:hypothetical protein
MVQRNGKADLKEYIEGIAKWVDMKEDFLPSMQTATGRKVAEARQKRNRYICSLIEKEKENFEINETYGILGVIKYFMSFHEDPSLTGQMNSLDNDWIPERKQMLANENSGKEIAQEGIKRAVEFNSLLRKEAEGEI